MKLTFTQSPLDHAGLKRTDAEWIAIQRRKRDAMTVLLVKGDLAIQPDGQPLLLHPDEAADLPLVRPGLVFLGLAGETPWFCAALEPGRVPPGQPFRLAAMTVEPNLATIMGRAQSVLAWHRRRQFCSNCATPPTPVDGGLKLQCPGCGMEHFPRVDPSVIMLPVHGDRCVMGRQAAWPEGLFATLAGFMEPGETIEQACARETLEEIGLKVTSTRYLASQPWPFPSSLMIGLIAEIEDGTVRPDDDLEDARWFTRDETRALHEGPMSRWGPPHFSISRLIIQTWLDEA